MAPTRSTLQKELASHKRTQIRISSNRNVARCGSRNIECILYQRPTGYQMDNLVNGELLRDVRRYTFIREIVALAEPHLLFSSMMLYNILDNS